MCGSDGGGVPADNSLQLQQERFAREDRLAAEERARQEQEKADREARYQVALNAARTGARSSAEGILSSRGLATNEFMPLIDTEINRIASTIPSGAEAPGSYFADNLADIVLGREEGARRTNYTNTLNSTFTPNYAHNAFADTADDPILESIFGSQYGEAQQAVERARARGTLNDQGYSAATRRLSETSPGARSTLQTLGGTVLSRNRDALTGIANEGRSAANSYTLGSQFDPTTYTSRAESTRNDLNNRLEGDVRSAVGGTQLFNIGDIIGFGGREQGAQNNPSNAIAEVLAQRENRRTAQRGLGSTGAF